MHRKNNRKPQILILSHVYPFPGTSGQQQRVLNTLLALRGIADVTFLTSVPSPRASEAATALQAVCERAVVMPARYTAALPCRLIHRTVGWVWKARTGLKFSNYVIGELEFTPSRIAQYCPDESFDVVLFEYWHAWQSVAHFQRRGIRCVIDMHNVMWQSYARQLSAGVRAPGFWRNWAVERYRRTEEAALNCFDGIVAINRLELEYVRSVVREDIKLTYAPMGIDLNLWPYLWQPVNPPRLAYYGGLGSAHNRRDALACYQRIMPLVWETCPAAELWIVGGNPPPKIQKLSSDHRVRVTGFVKDVKEVLKTVTAVVCPWQGAYGFRSRLIEAMAVGVPVVTTPDAVYGMDLQDESGVLLRSEEKSMANACVWLITESGFCRVQSARARAAIEQRYSFDATYGALAQWLLEFCHG